MKAVVIDDSRPERPLVIRDVPDPVPGPMDLLVAVRTAGVTRADLRPLGNHFATSEKHVIAITGLEFAGEVIETGAQVRGFARGDRVMAMAGGANAERVVVDHRLALPAPDAFSWEQAAATPISFLTAFNAVADAAALQPGENLLIQGGSASVGIAATQIARLRGAGVIFGTASTAEKLQRIRELGCDAPINYRTDDVASVVKERTGGTGVPVVIDLIGGATAQGNVEAAAIEGRIICVGRIDDRATIDLNEFARKRLRMLGVSFRTRTLEQRADVVRRFRDEFFPALEKGTAFPLLDRVYPMSEAERALARVRDHSHIGKVVLRADF